MSVRSPHQGHRSGACLRSSLKVPLDMASDHVLITIHIYIYIYHHQVDLPGLRMEAEMET